MMDPCGGTVILISVRYVPTLILNLLFYDRGTLPAKDLEPPQVPGGGGPPPPPSPPATAGPI